MPQVQQLNPSRLKEQNRILWALAVAQRAKNTNFLDVVRELISVAADFLGARNVSIWEFHNQRSKLECTQIYDSHAKAFGSGQILDADDYPAYFAACNERVIAIPDVSKDPRAAELLQGYLLPSGVTAMLDVPVFLGSLQQGIVCFEHSGGVRDWTEEDCVFAIAIADLVGLAIADREHQETLGLVESGLESCAQVILVCRSDGSIARCNRIAGEVFGYDTNDLLKLSIEDLLPDVLMNDTGAITAALLDTQDVYRHTTHTQLAAHRSGRKFPVEFSVSHLTHWRSPQALVILADISERHQRALQLERSEALYRSVVEDQIDLIIRVTADERLCFYNSALQKTTGLTPEELQNKSVYEFVPEDEHYIIKDAVARMSPTQPVISYSHQFFVKGNILRTYSWTVRAFYDELTKLSGYQAIGRDITQEMEKQERLRDAQRFEALAILAGGMAHDFNNLLTPILSFTDLAQTSLPPESEEREYLGYVMEAAMRARDLARLVLVFSKKGESRERHPVYAGHFIREILTFLRATASSRIRFHEKVDLDCGVINASPTDLYQILSNLCTNAIQSMPAGGDLTVTCSKVRRASDEMLQIEVIDTGAGIQKDQLARIFDPFFTTKPQGEGTGLGLPVVRSIIEELGGSIACQSTPGKGTSFVLYLPLVDALPNVEMAGVPPAVLRGSEHILVVDDENFIALALRNGLERLGYTVTTRSSANEALIAFRATPAAFDALVTDFTMPFMTGIELSWLIHNERPELPVVLISGYGQLLTPAEIARAGIAASINKPFVTEEVASVLRQILNKRK
ncbi:MAG: ATP-binding protein [Pseudomonadota bacterium]